MRFVLGVAALFLLAGCGSTAQVGGSGIAPDTSAPPITAVDEAPPKEALYFLERRWGADAGGGDVSEMCWSTNGGTECPKPTADQLAQMKAQQQRYFDSIRPAPDSPPRLVAKLALRDGGQGLFIAWRNGSGSLCWQVEEQHPDNGGGGGPAGPCTDVHGCDAICLNSGASGIPTDWMLSGTVAADAEGLRVTRADGAVVTYPLAGPVLPGSTSRVFMLELGRSDWRKLELVRDGDVVETTNMPAAQAAWEDCSDRIGPMPTHPPNADMEAMKASLRAYSDQMSACVGASTAPPR